MNASAIHRTLRVLILCFAAATGVRSLRAQTEYTADGTPGVVEEEIRWHTNRARFDRASENTARGTSYADIPATSGPLAPNDSLSRAARHHSEDMAKKNKFQHETIPGSAYYNASTQPEPWDRFTAEGYGSYRAVAENISAGYPSAEAAYLGWWNSTGHRVNLGNATYLEIGDGNYYWSASTYGNYYTMDLGARSASFFTDTLFTDANGNGKYTQGEGVNGVKVSLRVNGAAHTSFDVSAAAGSFAVPVSAIARTAAVEVWLTNQRGAVVTLSIPRNYATLESVALAAGEARLVGTISHPGTGVNYGFRNLVKATSPSITMPAVTLTRSGSTSQLSWTSQTGQQYQPQWSANLTTWTDFTGGYKNGTGGVMTQADTATAARRYYRVAVKKP
jgi:hypothetical protein